MRTRARAGTPAVAVTVVLLCGLTLALGYLNKARCAGAPFAENGRSLVFDRLKDSNFCYSDIQFLWLGRDIDNHVFPYLTGGITADGLLTGGTVEYPVLSGLLMWLGGIGAHTDAQFLLNSALILVPFGLATAWMLGRLAGWPALLWAAAPPLVLYAFHNWELPVVAAATAATFVVVYYQRIPLRTRAIGAAVLLAIGLCLKIYPGAFVLPLMAFVFTGGVGGAELPTSVRGRFDPKGALLVAASAAGTVIAINLPFAVAGYPGWLASFTFQSDRQADITTNSVWYWGVRHLFGGVEGPGSDYATFVSVASPLLIAASFALALWLGYARYRREGSYPWIAVSAAMLCGFLLLHKVHSPQYTLWLIPFLVLLRVPWALIAGYLVADLAIGIGVFRYFYELSIGSDASAMEFAVQFGVWGRAALLVVLFFVFLRARPRWEGTPAAEDSRPAVGRQDPSLSTAAS
ncbi:glycosyltransferase family 87 protein [Rhodococcus sp. NPDC058481]|uniref:glycosyltransferase family 87 protein n=1 Tax=unclassified Rhodococcus (in: high G+C Gram-positive bacteria) TaxID=192944 RepID=UPI00366A0B15